MNLTSPSEIGLCYLATPYTKYPRGILQAHFDAAKLAAKLLRAGVKVYSPICHTHSIAVLGGIDPLDHSIWMPFDEAMMTVAQTLIVAHMEGRRESYGIKIEVDFFERAGKPIFDLNPVDLMMTRRRPGMSESEFAHNKTRSEHAGTSG